MNDRNVLAKASQPSTPVNFDVPECASDCHTHIHGDPAKFPFLAGHASKLAPDYPGAPPLAKALVAANPDRIIWGADWPHPDSSHVEGRKPTDTAPFYPIDDGCLLNQLPVRAPDADVIRNTQYISTHRFAHCGT